MKNITTTQNRKRKIGYTIIIILVVFKTISFNIDKINMFFLRIGYEMDTKKYSSLASYQEFTNINEGLTGIFFGSVDCPHCVDNIKAVNAIVKEKDGVYYFKVDFNNLDNQKDLEKFKAKFKFDTIPHIVLFTKHGEKHYSSKNIAEYLKDD